MVGIFKNKDKSLDFLRLYDSYNLLCTNPSHFPPPKADCQLYNIGDSSEDNSTSDSDSNSDSNYSSYSSSHASNVSDSLNYSQPSSFPPPSQPAPPPPPSSPTSPLSFPDNVFPGKNVFSSPMHFEQSLFHYLPPPY